MLLSAHFIKKWYKFVWNELFNEDYIQTHTNMKDIYYAEFEKYSWTEREGIERKSRQMVIMPHEYLNQINKSNGQETLCTSLRWTSDNPLSKRIDI